MDDDFIQQLMAAMVPPLRTGPPTPAHGAERVEETEDATLYHLAGGGTLSIPKPQSPRNRARAAYPAGRPCSFPLAPTCATSAEVARSEMPGADGHHRLLITYETCGHILEVHLACCKFIHFHYRPDRDTTEQ